MVSVIIPVYNNSDTLDRCLTSVCKQSYNDLQIIVINDGSTDNLKNTYSDPRLLWIDSPHRGVSHARNLGLAHATGEYITFLDADDCFSSNDSIKDLMGHSTDLVIGGFKQDYLTQLGIMVYIKLYLLRPNKNIELIYVWGKLFKREIIEKNKIRFAPSMDKHEDCEFILKYLCHCRDVFITGKNVYTYYDNPKGLRMKMGGAEENREILLGHISHYGFSKDLINHCRVSITIVDLVRAYVFPFKEHYRFVYKISHDKLMRQSLKDYRRLPGNSMLIPLLMKMKCCFLLTLLCRMKGRKRYEKNNIWKR
jgi:glycosyltransferase involved in cell wall biosynthesis